MSKKLKGVLIDVENECVMPKEIEDSLDNFYEILNCNIIDITTRDINGKRYEIVLDDEGLLVEQPRISAINSYNEPMLVGNLFICKEGYGGELESLTTDDINHILECVEPVATWRHPKPYLMLTKCDYIY